jgi:hypothetical protein
MTGKREKITTCLLLQVFWNKETSMGKNAVFPDCFRLSALTYSRMAEVQKFITLSPLSVSGSVNNCWKAEKLFYVCPVYALT